MKTCLVFLSLTVLGASAISGGVIVQDRSFPFAGVIEMVNSSHYCGCSIISETDLLTASHCIDGLNPDQIQIILGTNTIREGGTIHQVSTLILHETDDIGIIKLDKPIEFNDGVGPIQLEKEHNDNVRECTAVGWGRETASSPLSYELESIKLKTMTNEDCAASGVLNLKDGEICTFTGAKEGICFGDTGGCVLNENNECMAIPSRGYPCALGRPDVHVRVSSFTNWIKKHVKID